MTGLGGLRVEYLFSNIGQYHCYFPNGLDSTSVTDILKNTTTLLRLRNMF